MEGHEPTAGKIVSDDGRDYLLVMTHEYFNIEGAHREYGMSKITDRKADRTEGSTKVYQMGFGPRKVERHGLEFGGRYVLRDSTSDDPEVYGKFELEFHSVSEGPKDKVQMGQPGFTIAAWNSEGRVY